MLTHSYLTNLDYVVVPQIVEPPPEQTLVVDPVLESDDEEKVTPKKRSRDGTILKPSKSSIRLSPQRSSVQTQLVFPLMKDDEGKNVNFDKDLSDLKKGLLEELQKSTKCKLNSLLTPLTI